jgi:hypothetical protein
VLVYDQLFTTTADLKHERGYQLVSPLEEELNENSTKKKCLKIKAAIHGQA